jgi:hypothetical protein
MRSDDYARAYRILKLSNQVSKDVNIDEVFDPSILVEAEKS